MIRRFDTTLAHSLICVQANTGIPEEHRECVCAVRVIEHASHASHRTYAAIQPERMYQPDYGIEGPYNGGPYGVIDAIVTRAVRFVRWLVGLAIAIAVVAGLSFITGAVLRHFGVI